MTRDYDASVSAPPVPRAGVVIPAHGSATLLARVLASIAAVDWPADHLRVVVGVDGPDARLEQAARAGGAEVVVLPVNRGSYAARNAAIAALGEDVDLVAFTDTDCIVSPGWLRAHAAALTEVDLSAGGVRVTLRPRPSPAEFVDRHRHLRQAAYVEVERYGATANLAVRAGVLRSVLFDDSLRSSGDAEFCHRAQDAGFTLGYTEDAWVEHPARRTDREVMTKIRRICRGIEANPAPWRSRTASVNRSLHVPRLAYQQGLSRSPFWLLRAWLLEVRASAAIARTVRRVRDEQGWSA